MPDHDEDVGCEYELVTRIAQSFSDDVNDYKIQINGNIEHVQYDEAGIEIDRARVGRLKAFIYLLEDAYVNRESLWDLMDGDLQEACEIYTELFDEKTGELKSSIFDLSGQSVFSHNLLYIHSVEILPKYRGKGLGIKAMRRLLKIHRIADGIAVTSPAPINPKASDWDEYDSDEEWKQKMQYALFECSEKQAQEKLAKHWQQVGFIPVPGSNWHIWYRFPEDQLSGEDYD